MRSLAVRKRRPKFVHYIPENYIEPLFQVVEVIPGATYWHAKIVDAIVNDCPEFRYTPPKKGCPFTIQELANCVAGELNEARGMFSLREYKDGIPVFLAYFISNGREVVCAESSDETRIAAFTLTEMIRRGNEWLASRKDKP